MVNALTKKNKAAFMLTLSDNRGKGLMGELDDGPKKMNGKEVTISEKTKISIGTLVLVGFVVVALFGWIQVENRQTQASIIEVKSELVKIRFEIERLKADSSDRFTMNAMRLWAMKLGEALKKCAVDVEIPDPIQFSPTRVGSSN